MARIILKKNEDRRLLNGHQWIFSNEIASVDGEASNGDVIELYSSNQTFLGKGFYNKNSLIAYRHLTHKDEDINKEFIFKRISLANSLRKKHHPDKDVYRLVNSESDYLPGLIIDRFDDKFSIQVFSFGMDKYAEIIFQILIENFKAKLIVEKNHNELRVLEGLEKRESIVYKATENSNETFEVLIDGLKYKIDLLSGQKTGFYLDQCQNRLLLRNYVNERSNVLDLFCNEGGFALNASLMKAASVKAVDSSEHSIEIAKANARLNELDNIDFVCQDVFEYLNDLFQSNERFDFIVLDPPSFAKSKKNLFMALKGYGELNYKAMRLLKPNSFLFTFSCSHHVSEKNFEEMLVKSSALAKRKIQIVEFSNCSVDHPILLQMPETKYLKGYLLRIV